MAQPSTNDTSTTKSNKSKNLKEKGTIIVSKKCRWKVSRTMRILKRNISKICSFLHSINN
jgi:hypothetical protein